MRTSASRAPRPISDCPMSCPARPRCRWSRWRRPWATRRAGSSCTGAATTTWSRAWSPARGVAATGDRRHARHAHAGLAPARPRRCVPALHPRPGHRAVHERPCLPRARRGAGAQPSARGSEAARDARGDPHAVRHDPQLPGRIPALTRTPGRGRHVPRRVLAVFADLGRSEVPARAHEAPDRAQRHPASGRRRARDRPRDRRHRGVESRRPPDRRRDRVGGCAAASGRARRFGRIPVLFDSGIRSGADVFTAIALGAAAVLVGAAVCLRSRDRRLGRGRSGAANIVAELDLVLGLSGHRSVSSSASMP